MCVKLTNLFATGSSDAFCKYTGASGKVGRFTSVVNMDQLNALRPPKLHFKNTNGFLFL